LKLIVDSNMICHQLKYKMVKLSFDEMRTEIVFGFFLKIMQLSNLFETNQFSFVWDSPRNLNLRKKIFPAYKEKRDDKTEEEKIVDRITYPQLDIIQETLTELGFANNFKITGYEGDDLIASIVNNNKGPFCIVSSDSDLYQLLSKNVYMYSLKTKKRYYSSDLEKEYGVGPEAWATVKALGGCITDEVPGVKGVREKTASKFIQGKLPVCRPTYSAILASKELFERNKRLVTLPFEGTPDITLREDNLDYSKFLSFFNRHGFESLLTKENRLKWRKFTE
jgi:5'-3' exonuclease